MTLFQNKNTLKTRLAPTPSGFLHIGNGAAFVATWALARAFEGKILLRIDDLDAERMRPEYIEDIFKTLDWLGLDWDEGPFSVGDFFKNWSETMRGVCADSGRTKQECDATSRQSLEVWSRCLRHAVQECVKHGGRCTVA